MKEEQIKEYVGNLLQMNPVDDKILVEVDNAIKLLTVYRYGLEQKEFPIDVLLGSAKIERDVPGEYRTTVCQMGIIKSGQAGRDITGYLVQSENILKRFRKYFILPN